MDIQAQHETIRADVEAAVMAVMDRGIFILGPEVAAFEQEMADYLGVAHAVGVASGTDALVLSLRALGIGPGDEVIVPAYTFFATCGAVLQVGATPVLVDIDPATYCLNVGHLEQQLGPRTKAIIPVHLFGHPADMDAVLIIAEEHGLRVIEDNAQAIGASYEGRRTGSLGDVGCLSFYPSKNIGAYGDAGMVVTNDEDLASRIRMLRTHGWRRKYFPEIAGQNSRLDELQATILRVKLPHLDEWNERRRAHAVAYDELLSDLDIRTPIERPPARHVYHLYVIETEEREQVAEHLQSAGVDTAVYYPYPLHLVPAVAGLGYRKGDFPVSEEAARRCMAIPLFPEMTAEQVEYVASVVRSVVATASVQVASAHAMQDR